MSDKLINADSKFTLNLMLEPAGTKIKVGDCFTIFRKQPYA